MKFRLFVSILCFLLNASAWAAPGTMIKDDELRAGAMSGAAVVGRASKGAAVDVLQRRAGWTQISHAGVTGWVRILSVRVAVESGGNVLGGIVQMGGSRRDPSRVVAVAGLRGLNEEELRGAHFNASELSRLNQYACNRADAEQFARAARLSRIDVAYIAAAKQARENGPNNNVWGDGGI